MKDGRTDFYLGNREGRPVWMGGVEPGDGEVRALFAEAAGKLREDPDPTAAFSRYLERMEAPGSSARIELSPASREPGRSYAKVKVPEGADGRVWHTSSNTRGEIRFLNIPPLLGFHRGTVLVPREVFEAAR